MSAVSNSQTPRARTSVRPRRCVCDSRRALGCSKGLVELSCTFIDTPRRSLQKNSLSLQAQLFSSILTHERLGSITASVTNSSIEVGVLLPFKPAGYVAHDGLVGDSDQNNTVSFDGL